MEEKGTKNTREQERPKTRNVLEVSEKRMEDIVLDKEKMLMPLDKEEEELPKYGRERSGTLDINKTRGQAEKPEKYLEYDISLPKEILEDDISLLEEFDNDAKKLSQFRGRTGRRERKGKGNNQNKVINFLDSYISFIN